MKKCFLFALAAIIFCGCQKDNFVESSEVTTGPSLLKLQISMDKLSTGRAIEDGHTTGLTPRIYSVTVFAYNEYGVATELDLSDAQIKEAISGSYFFKNDKDATNGTATIVDGKVTKGASIGLPVGTSKVDVVMNNPSSKYKDLSQNINYFNHQNRKTNDGGWPDAADDSGYFGNNNYDRVFLVTDDYGKGVALDAGTKATEDPSTKVVETEYRKSFTVKPALARFEVHGSINVAPETDWSDAFGCWWRRIAKSELTKLVENDNTLKDIYDDINKKLKQGMCEETIETIEYINIPEAYIAGGNKEKEYDYNHGNSPVVGTWTVSDYYKLLTPDNQNTTRWAQVQWYPNTFYAIDVEEIYVNNIHVPSADPAVAPILTPWPGFENLGEPKGWPHWYKAYHLHGWHTAGYSSTNGFYCMGNMWDRIAEADPTNVIKDALGTLVARGAEAKVDWNGLSISDVNGSGELHTTYLTGGTLPIEKVSAYGDQTTKRNIGIIANKAAAYMIYDQISKTGAGKEPDAYTDLPHIIVKIKCYKDKASYAAGIPTSGKNFITMKLFSEDGTAAKYITKFERGTIYRVDLNNLVKSFIGEIPVKNLPGDDANKEPKPTDPVTPDPEMPGSQLIMGIKVLDWVVKNAMPII